MEVESWLKIGITLGVPMLILAAIGYAAWKVGWRLSAWAEPHVNAFIAKGMELVDVLIDFHQSTKARLAAIEEAQSLTNQKVFEVHEVIMKSRDRIQPVSGGRS